MGQTESPNSGSSIYECGLSTLETPLPERITVRVGWLKTAAAWLPIPLGIAALAFEEFTVTPGLFKEMYLTYTLMLVVIISIASLAGFHAYRRWYQRTQEALYLDEVLRPALALTGVIASQWEARILMQRKDVIIDPDLNLYRGNSMRLITLATGEQAVQFEYII